MDSSGKETIVNKRDIVTNNNDDNHSSSCSGKEGVVSTETVKMEREEGMLVKVEGGVEVKIDRSMLGRNEGVGRKEEKKEEGEMARLREERGEGSKEEEERMEKVKEEEDKRPRKRGISELNKLKFIGAGPKMSLPDPFRAIIEGAARCGVV